ncbi:unnamed protein product [Linum trigynum]|uniref:Uncharacterized protein n=1 Tax=Linum trigynum TaxID=586398 RepID=A0AAV2GP18_9ROSI
MHPKSIQVLLRTPNSRRLQTLTFDPSQPQTLRSLKLSLIPDHGNPRRFLLYRQREAPLRLPNRFFHSFRRSYL